MKEVSKKKFKKQIKGKKIVFHKSFSKGFRLALCVNCGYPFLFCGVIKYKGYYTLDCLCKKPKFKIYNIDKLEDFIIKLQGIMIKIEPKQTR